MRSAIAALGFTACQVAQDIPTMPWLHGLSDVVSSDRALDEVGRRMGDRSEHDRDCAPGAYTGIELTANVAPAAGTETIQVSLAHGVVVLDLEDQPIAEAPGYECEGSATELEAVAAGDAFGMPLIAIAATTGGHRVSSTWITLLRVGPDRTIDAVFTGTVEERDGETVRRGGVVMLPNALIYRHPRRQPRVWIYNPLARAYLVPGDPIDDSHDAGPSVTTTQHAI